MSPFMMCVDVDVESKFFKLSNIEKQANGDTVYSFSQCENENENLCDWHRLSKVYLGDVLLLTEDNKLKRLCVVLETVNQNKQNVVTVVNPTTGNVLRTDPHQILEVVIYGQPSKKHFFSSDYSFCNITAGVVKYEQIDHKIIFANEKHSKSFLSKKDLDVDNVFCLYPRTFEECNEFHFWFKLTPASVDYLSSCFDLRSSYELHNAGKIEFKGDGLLNVLELKTHLTKSTYKKICPISKKPKKTQGDLSELSELSKSSEIESIVENKSWFQSIRMKKTSLILKDNAPLSDGCKVVYCDLGKKKSTQSDGQQAYVRIGTTNL